jgi:tetraacyldisaccharide 4'-kinase
MFRLLLIPFSFLYGLVVALRNLLFDFKILKSHQFDIPVISVGNITVGGTGKTPHVEYLAQLLKDKCKVAILSRGYKRKTKGFVLAKDNPKTKDVGDEPAQMKFKFPELDIAINADRVEGITALEQRKNEIIILDDAFQHRYVKPGLSILLIDFNRRIDKSHLLPYGNLRESANEIRRADMIIVTKTPSEIKPIERRVIIEQIHPYPFQQLYFTGFNYGKFESVFNKNMHLPSDFHNNHEIYTFLVITGIAYSRPFIDHLKSFSQDIVHIELADHSSYNLNKLNKIANSFRAIRNDKKIIITTEKDAVKLREFEKTDEILLQNMFFVPIEVEFIDGKIEFENQILDYVRKNKRNGSVCPK